MNYESVRSLGKGKLSGKDTKYNGRGWEEKGVYVTV